MYIDYDLLEEAASLAIEYLDAVSGKGREYFGLKTYLHCGAPAICLPYTAFDQLLMALRDVATDATLNKVMLLLSTCIVRFSGRIL